LERLKKLIEASSDPSEIANLGYSLSHVSYLISCIERSHLGEFSWPFAFCLRAIAVPLCTEQGPSGKLPPIIHILAEGDLSAYAILPESYDPDPIRLKRIINVVFPRTLKHHVLLHAIFGHEIGHAAWAIPDLRAKLDKQVIAPLFKGTPLENAVSAEQWITAATRPKVVSDYLLAWKMHPNMEHDFTFSGPKNKTLLNWQQEFFCDLFGAVVFGPSYGCAHRMLLQAIDPTGNQFTVTHPPYASRAQLMSRASDLLKWFDGPRTGNANMDSAIGKTESYVKTALSPDPWFDIFPGSQVEDAINGLKSVLATFSGTVCLQPVWTDFAPLVDAIVRRVPPCGAELDAAGDPQLREVDFRQILTAGWIAWVGRTDIPGDRPREFFHVNLLCDRGILQQSAVHLHGT
jgi:hypothetical protein